MKRPQDANLYDRGLLINCKDQIEVSPVFASKVSQFFIVYNPESAFKLWYGGCYGKGSLSRSQPEYLLGLAQYPDANTTEHLTLSIIEILYLHLEFKLFNSNVISTCLERVNASIVRKLTVYHHYRQLGFVVRHGAQFGCDFMLYKEGPTFNHSFAGVVVDDGLLKMADLLGELRVLNGVQKRFIVARVDAEEGVLQNVSVNSIEDLQKLMDTSKVTARSISRWEPSRTRD
ncbi:hypothetical protein MIR68_004268 [Amoeboaphelidium protococcarum]|nr:hypothetical protein MIR68_004268 [Amoeboaphelidium protococcarum]